MIDQYNLEGRRHGVRRLIDRSDVSGADPTYSASGLVHKAMGATDPQLEGPCNLDEIALKFYLEHSDDHWFALRQFQGFRTEIELLNRRGQTPLEIGWWLDENFGS